MKKSFVFSLAVFGMLLSTTTLCAQVSNDNEDGVYKPSKYMPRYVDGEVIVKFKDSERIDFRRNIKGRFLSASANKVNAKLREMGTTEVEPLMPLTGAKVQKGSRKAISSKRMIKDRDLSQLYVVRFDKEKLSVTEAVEQLKALDNVEFAEPNAVVTICATDDETPTYDDPLFVEQWGLPAINLPQLWAQPKIESRRPVIAILDTGVDITHPDLAANIWTNQMEAAGVEFEDDDNNGYFDDLHGWDFVSNTAIINSGMDRNGHGTHCAGIAAAVGNNGIGIVGANPDAFILPIKVMGDDGSGDNATVIRGIDYAIAAGADILSMSFGGFAPSMGAVESALEKAYAKYIISIAAAGNSGCDVNVVKIDIPSPVGPGAFDFVVGVMASGNDSQLAGFSNYDPDGPFFTKYEDTFYGYDVLAPGKDIMSTYPGGKYKMLNGTSMATPMVAGAVSRALQVKGFDYCRDYGLYGDIAMSRMEGSDVLDANMIAYWNEDNRKVALRLAATQIQEIEGDMDGRIDVGEVVDIYPTIRSLWGYAHNIKVHARIDNPNVSTSALEFLTNDVDFGYDLNSQGMATSKNPIRVKINEKVNDGYNIPIYFSITCDDEVDEETGAEKEVPYTVENVVEIGGMVTEDLTLYPNVNYMVTQNMAVPAGVTLTIKPGTVIKFRDGTGLSVASVFKDLFDDNLQRVSGIDRENSGKIIAHGTPDSMIVFTKADNSIGGYTLSLGAEVGVVRPIIEADTIEYAVISNVEDYASTYLQGSVFKNCILKDIRSNSGSVHGSFIKTNIINLNNKSYERCRFCNLNYLSFTAGNLRPFFCPEYMGYDGSVIGYNVIGYNNMYPVIKTQYAYAGKTVVLYSDASTPTTYTTEHPSYFGSSREDIVRRSVFDIESGSGFGYFDLNNMLTRPVAEAHGMVWKVVVNGFDAQDEFEQLPPLGVGKHKFEVYFNRPMDVSVAPTITMGLREPYTQTTIAEDGSWSEDSLIYTAYYTVTGKDNIDGLNRIYVCGAEDNEHFEIIEENTRFNVMVQKAGSMSTGLMAEAGLGKVKLTWETDEADFADLMGYNVYRYHEYEDSVRTQYDANGNYVGYHYEHFIACDTVMVNDMLLESTETELIDYDVVPGTTYYYMIKEIGTDLQQHDVSNVVACTPLTASKGDANGSMSVDIADVVTEVAYLTFQDPQPFIFEAADVNSDEEVDILDVVGTVGIIIAPTSSSTMSMSSEPAVYTIEDGIVYLETSTTIGGIQIMLNADKAASNIEVLDGIPGFEQVSVWKNDNEYLFLAYSMSGKTLAPGKYAILKINEDAEVTDMVLSDALGKNVLAVNGTASSISDLKALPHGVSIDGNATYRVYDMTGRSVNIDNMDRGVYIVGIYVDGKQVKSYKYYKK